MGPAVAGGDRAVDGWLPIGPGRGQPIGEESCLRNRRSRATLRAMAREYLRYVLTCADCVV